MVLSLGAGCRFPLSIDFLEIDSLKASNFIRNYFVLGFIFIIELFVS
jgi:hypothetical protein